jgi:hypothetical protein
MGFWRRKRRGSDISVSAREVEGAPLPAEQRIGSDLCDVRFEPSVARVRFDRVTVERVDFSGLSFSAFGAEACQFIDCDFSRVQVEWLPLVGDGSRFLRCCFDGARIGDFGDVELIECDFTDAHLNGWFTWGADVIDCRFAGRLEGVVFTATDIDGRGRNDIRGNDFRDADLVDVDFRNGVDLDKQLFPESDEYLRIRDLPGALMRAQEDVERWPRDERRQALEALDLIARVESGQPDVFTRREFLIDCADDRAIGERVVALLARDPSTPG